MSDWLRRLFRRETLWVWSFVLIMLGVGCGLFFLGFLPTWKARQGYREHACTVLDSRVSTQTRQVNDAEEVVHVPEFLIAYSVDGREYRVWTYLPPGHDNGFSKEAAARVIARYGKGTEQRCWYDPAHPRKSVLDRGDPTGMWINLGLALLAVALVSVALGLLLWKTPPEDRPPPPPTHRLDMLRRDPL